MDWQAAERATVLIVRAWTESGPPATLKIRMLTTPTPERPPTLLGVTTDIDQACALLRAWLSDVASWVEPADRRQS